MPQSAFLIYDKPKGLSSHRALSVLKKTYATTTVGHAGTLDPLATGILLIGIGQGTRLLEFLVGLPKTYEATITLGTTSDTLDADGTLTPTHISPPATPAPIHAALTPFLGTHPQMPPQHSAIKIAGKKAYDLARSGETAPLTPRTVTLYSAALTAYTPPHVSLTLMVSSGYYIRSLARDLGAALGCGAHLSALRRTAVGDFTLSQAGTPLPLSHMISRLPRTTVTQADALRLSCGQRLVTTLPNTPHLALFTEADTLLGIARTENGVLHPTKILQADTETP